MVIGAEPPARTSSAMPFSSSTVRSTVNSSTGGTDPVNLRSGSLARKAAATTAINRTGRRAQAIVRPIGSSRRGLLQVPDIEHAHPAEFDELRLVVMHHVHAGLVVRDRDRKSVV